MIDMRNAARAKEILIMDKADKLYASMFEEKVKKTMAAFTDEKNSLKV